MKTTFITFLSFIILFFGCSTMKETSVEEIEVVEASFKHWSDSPPVTSDVRERGTDLELIVRNFPADAKPNYIIFRKIKSFPAEVVDSTDSGVRIQARIIRSSAVMEETSESAELSDRLVFTKSDGKRRYLLIEEWGPME